MPKTSAIKIRPQSGPSPLATWLVLGIIFVCVQVAALFRPPLLDDVDASHAEAAQHMAETGNLVTLYINGVRYLEKPPLPYWLVAGLYRVFGQNVFATLKETLKRPNRTTPCPGSMPAPDR